MTEFFIVLREPGKHRCGRLRPITDPFAITGRQRLRLLLRHVGERYNAGTRRERVSRRACGRRGSTGRRVDGRLALLLGCGYVLSLRHLRVLFRGQQLLHARQRCGAHRVRGAWLRVRQVSREVLELVELRASVARACAPRIAWSPGLAFGRLPSSSSGRSGSMRGTGVSDGR